MGTIAEDEAGFGPHRKYWSAARACNAVRHEEWLRELEWEPRSRGAAALATGISGAFNLGSGTRIAINRLVELLRSCAGVKFRTEYAPPRKGDVRHSLADISAAREKFSFEPSVSIAEGLRQYVGWVESSYRVPAAAN